MPLDPLKPRLQCVIAVVLWHAAGLMTQYIRRHRAGGGHSSRGDSGIQGSDPQCQLGPVSPAGALSAKVRRSLLSGRVSVLESQGPAGGYAATLSARGLRYSDTCWLMQPKRTEPLNYGLDLLQSFLLTWILRETGSLLLSDKSVGLVFQSPAYIAGDPKSPTTCSAFCLVVGGIKYSNLCCT